MGLHESVCKSIKKHKLHERAETNIKKIDFIELNEFLAGLKEHIEYDINPDLEYFKVILEADNNKAYIDVASKNEDEWDLDGWTVEDILSANDIDEYIINKDSFNKLKDEMLSEKEYIENRIIPKLAREWGFRNVKKLNNSISEDIEDKEPILMQDMIDYNLFREGKNYFVIDHNDKVKYFDESGKVVVKNHYDIGQCEFDFDGMYQMYFLSLIDKEDASLIQKVADVLGFDVEFVEGQKRRLKDGYNYLCVMYIPISVLEMPVPDYLVKYNINPDLFKDKSRVVSRMNMTTKRLNKKK